MTKEDYILAASTLRTMGDKPAHAKAVTVKLPEDVLAILDYEATRHGVARNTVLVMALTDWFEKLATVHV